MSDSVEMLSKTMKAIKSLKYYKEEIITPTDLENFKIYNTCGFSTCS